MKNKYTLNKITTNFVVDHCIQKHKTIKINRYLRECVLF